MDNKEAFVLGFSYKRFALMCIEKNTNPSTVAQMIGLSNAAATGWKKGKQPRGKTVEQMATVLECAVEDLLEETKEKPATNQGDGLDYKKALLMQLWDSLDESGQAALLADATSLANNRRQKDNH